MLGVAHLKSFSHRRSATGKVGKGHCSMALVYDAGTRTGMRQLWSIVSRALELKQI
jgi:hypothetical protein